MAAYPLQSISVLCGNCNTVVAAPRGHPVVRCGNCSSLLQIGGAEPMQNAPPSIQATFMQQRQQRRQRSEAASEAAIASLYRFEAGENFIRSNQECAICADDFREGQRVACLPCEHGFHEQCVDKWLRQKNTCPVCRYELPRAEPEQEAQQQPGNPHINTLPRGTHAYTPRDPYFLEDTQGRPVYQGTNYNPHGPSAATVRIHRVPRQQAAAGCVIS
eukprot:gb/GECG01006959.1/.p1 GENE.gb/GECG01006959.1/~~gb/GECG01006959.1/.p1  ORF type:complete len:217 (+),score=18.17 gb/GECG01006959.1/:1-651(+)